MSNFLLIISHPCFNILQFVRTNDTVEEKTSKFLVILTVFVFPTCINYKSTSKLKKLLKQINHPQNHRNLQSLPKNLKG